MKNQRKRSLAALLLAVGMLFTLPTWVTGSVRALDDTVKCSLTVTSGREAGDDIENAEVVIDLYKVADANLVEGYDTYDYNLAVPYAGLESELETARTVPEDQVGQENAGNNQEAWMSLANRAASIALETQGLDKVTVDMGQRAENLDWGLYLVIAHGENLSEEQYIKTQEGRITTIAQSPTIEYSFTPYLVSLPNKESLNTSSGDWMYDVEGALKAEQEERFGDLELVKTLDGYSPAAGASFVFQVEARGADGEIVYSNVVSMEFTASGTQSYVLERIPAQSEVTVTEIYSGTAYTPAAATQTTTIIAADTVEVSFANSYTGGGNYSSSALNHFEYTADGWNWTQQ